MITTQWYNAFPMPLLGIASSQEASIVSALSQTPGFEVCACNGCDFIEEAYVKNGGSWWQNDTKSFIKAKVIPSDTIVFTLLKNGVQQAVLNSNTYGTYYDFGDLDNANYKGFIVDWNLVQQAFGYGYYTIKTTHTSLGTAYEYVSHQFHVVEYNAERADGTLRFEWYQSGSIMNGFDYTGIGWYQSLRIKGKFGDKTPNLIIDNYQDSDRVVKQIQTKIENTYTLETELLPAYIFDVLNEDGILGNDIYITDYNLLNQHLYRRFNIYPSNIKDVVNHSFSKKSNFVYEFKEKKDNIIKRNIEGDWATLPQQPSYTEYVCADAVLTVNGDSFTTIPSGETYDLVVKDENGDVVGSKVGEEWIVPASLTPSGVVLQFPTGQQYTSFRTGDEGSRIQAGWFSYTKPTNPAAIAELDTSLGANYWWRLKNNLKVGGVSNKFRFVDVDGGQTWSATNNKNKITIDKLTGLGFYRIENDLGAAVTWNNAIDNALTFSVTVNGVTYSDWYIASLEEIQALFGEISETGAGNIEDAVSTAIIYDKVASSSESWTSTTQSNSSGANAYSKGWNPTTYIRGVGKGSSFRPFIVFDAKSLISEP